MCQEEQKQHEEPYFIISRNNQLLKEQLKHCLLQPSGYQFSWQHGEFCVFLFDKATNRIIFGRDIFGRKSLCWRITKQQQKCAIELSLLPGRETSIFDNGQEKWAETPPGTLVILQLPNFVTIRAFPNDTLTSNKTKFLTPTNCPILDFYCLLPCGRDEFVAQKIFIHTYYPTTQLELNPLLQTFKNFDFSQIQSDILLKFNPDDNTFVQTLDVDTEISRLTQEFIQNFNVAVENILRAVAFMPNPTINEEIVSDDCKFTNLHVPVLFSGGVDSLMVALSAGDVLFKLSKQVEGKAFVGKIYLISVAFGEKHEDISQASDRAQSIVAFEHLRQRFMKKYGTNPYSLILINVSKRELIECRQKFIASTIFPCNTVLDDSIGCVLWFATRMVGVDYIKMDDSNGNDNIQMPPFALVGSGSDEQLGGYARHRTVFEKKGLLGLTAELSMEMHRIGERNLGRDDRVGMSNGRAIFAPFLEEHLVRWLNSVPTHIKTGYSLPASSLAFASSSPINPSIGSVINDNKATSDGIVIPTPVNIGNNKFLLRNSLRQLDMPEPVVSRPKRAMQFGTRIAKLEKMPGQKGSDVCMRLLIDSGAALAADRKCFDE